METNKNNVTVMPTWLVIVLVATILVLFTFIIAQQFLPIFTASGSPTATPMPSVSPTVTPISSLSTEEITINEISLGQSFTTTNNLLVKFVGVEYVQGKEVYNYNYYDYYYEEYGDKFIGLPEGNILLVLSIRIKNLNQTPQNYYHFARCFVRGIKKPCAKLISETYKYNGEYYKAEYHGEVNGDLFYSGEVDGGRWIEIELLFSVPLSTPKIDKSGIEFDYYCDTTEKSYDEKRNQGLYPEMCRLKLV